MHKLRVTRTPLIAVLGFLAFFAAPTVAQAHHIEATATCKGVGAQAVATLTVKFDGFTKESQPTVRGKVWLDGVAGSEKSWTNGPPPLSWNQTTGDATLTTSWNVDGGRSYLGKAQFSWTEPNGTKKTQNVEASTGQCPGESPRPAIDVEKFGPATAYVGDTVKFTYKVENIGNVVLTNPVVTDDKCAPVTKVANGQNVFDPGDIWDYECTMKITDAMGDELINTVKACGKYGNTEKCDEDDHKTKIPKPAILLDKTGAATANAGDTFTYSFVATNIGNVTLTNVQLTDDKCQSTLTRVEPNLSDKSFDKGDKWYYTCTVVAPAGPAQVDNIAKVCGDYNDGKLPKKTVCDDDPHTFTVPPPTTPPNNPPTTPPSSTPDTTPPPDGEVLPESIVSGRAQLRGPSGCVKNTFRARVSGRSIKSVTFFVDGRRVKKVNRGGTFNLKVNPKRYGLGRHKIVAVVRFRAASGTKARRLPLTFRRCAQGAVAPRFTG